MNKFNFALYFDLSFIFISGFFVNFAIFRYFIDSGIFVFFMSALFSFTLTFAYYKRAKIKIKKLTLTKEEQQLKEQLITQFCLNSEKTNISFFNNVFKKAGLSTIVRSKYIYTAENKTCSFFIFKFEKLTIGDIIDCYKTIRFKKIHIYTNCYDSPAESFVQKFKGEITLFNADKTYALLKKHETFPRVTKVFTKEKNNFKKNLKSLLNKDKAKPFTIFGFIMIIFSIIFPFSLYYLIIGSLILIYSIVCRFYGLEAKE